MSPAQPAGGAPAPAASRTQAIVRWTLALLLALAATASWLDYTRPPERTASVARYACPLHPAVTAPSPGACGLCGAELVPAPADAVDLTRAAATAGRAAP